MNSCNFYGRIASEIEMKYNESTVVATFSLAVTKRGREKGADFFRFKAFNKQAEVLEKFFHKGSRIAVTAIAVQPQKYTNKDGITVYPNVEFFVSSLDFVDAKNENTAEEQLQEHPVEQASTQKPVDPREGFMRLDESITEELPFR